MRPDETNSSSEESKPTWAGGETSTGYRVADQQGEVVIWHRVDTAAAAAAFLSRFVDALVECLDGRCEVDVDSERLVLQVQFWDAGECEIEIQPCNGIFGSVCLWRPDNYPSQLPNPPEVAVGVVLAEHRLG